jgi:hypothetical protein
MRVVDTPAADGRDGAVRRCDGTADMSQLVPSHPPPKIWRCRRH